MQALRAISNHEVFKTSSQQSTALFRTKLITKKQPGQHFPPFEPKRKHGLDYNRGRPVAKVLAPATGVTALLVRVLAKASFTQTGDTFVQPDIPPIFANHVF